jgi:hypothetical protein
MSWTHLNSAKHSFSMRVDLAKLQGSQCKMCFPFSVIFFFYAYKSAETSKMHICSYIAPVAMKILW